MNSRKTKREQRARRQKRIRAKIFGTKDKPRFAVFKSNKFIYAQIIDDFSGETLVSSSDIKISKKGKIIRAEDVGKDIAVKAIKKKIKKVVFDRSGFIFTGRVKALAESARKAGLIF